MSKSELPASSAFRLRVLFICIGNSCRSPMAESIALRDAADVFASRSAGLTPFGAVQKLTLETLESNGYESQGLSSKPILDEEWLNADIVINMSGYAKACTFPRSEWSKIEDWDVQDPYGSDPAVYQRIFDDIRSRIEALAARHRARAR
jgi:arsenate reductase (thioredoxin)